MTIEKNLERIATALEKIAAGAVGAAETAAEPEKPTRRRSGKKKDETPAATTPETPTVTRDQVREALRIFRKDHSKEDAIEILGKFEAKSITGADESVLPALLEAFTA